ncbi:hypothetical protein R1flu_028952 [Riccia fluitans]|uniref:NADH-ubiquinone oxidoreductase 21kDa subunit N-terminal domain-containing protein n=1 Tax=Riccia fluitans TaxID=41844 RepID=A0ABD1XNN4_9MARC
MGIFLDEPKFPVIDRSPSAGTTVSNFNFSDYLKITAITAGSLPVGYLAGGSVNIRGPSMYTAGLIGLMGGFIEAGSAYVLLAHLQGESRGISRFRQDLASSVLELSLLNTRGKSAANEG